MRMSASSSRALVGIVALAAACATGRPTVPVDTASAVPAERVTVNGTTVHLLGTPIAVGKPLPATALVESGTMRMVDLARERGKVLFLSIVVSLDTRV